MNRKLRQLVIVLLIAIAVNLGFYNKASAIIIKQIEAPQQILYQSRNSFEDNQGNRWQIILFNRVEQGKTKDLNLRLVGFPDVVNFEHPQDLLILMIDGEQFEAKDQFSHQAPSPNVGEYDFRSVLFKLENQKSIILSLPTTQKSLFIKIPYPILLEWKEIAHK